MSVSGMWRECRVEGHACHVYEPAQRSEHRFVVLYLHGVHLQTLHEHGPFLRAFDRHGLVCVSPMTGPTWWVNRRCQAFDSRFSPVQYLLEHILPWVRETYGVAPPAIGLLGSSMGGQGALRLAYLKPDLFPVVAALSPAIDYQWRMRDGDEILESMYDDEESARQDTALLHIHPLNWPRHQFFSCDPNDHRWYASVDRLKMKLASLGVPHECDLTTTGGGHSFEYYNRMASQAIDFLADRLDRERRRIP